MIVIRSGWRVWATDQVRVKRTFGIEQQYSNDISCGQYSANEYPLSGFYVTNA